MSMGKIVNDSEIKINFSTELPMTERPMITKTIKATLSCNVCEANYIYLQLGT